MDSRFQHFGNAPLADKVIVITGAGSGIGRATAAMAAAAGAFVVAADIAGSAESASSIIAAGGRASGLVLDVSDSSSWDAMVAAVLRVHSRIDGLANVAGVAGPADTLQEQTDPGWDRIMDINLKGPWYGMRAVMPAMIDSAAGRIVNVTSVAGITAMPGSIAYATSKGGVIAMTRQVAIEFAQKGVRVNAVAPGVIQTPMLGDGAEQSVNAMKALTPVGRIGDPAEIASMICYLLGPGADFISGQVFVVDGGWIAQ